MDFDGDGICRIFLLLGGIIPSVLWTSLPSKAALSYGCFSIEVMTSVQVECLVLLQSEEPEGDIHNTLIRKCYFS